MLPKANRSVFLSCLVAFLEADAATLPSNTKSIVIPNAASSDAGIPLDSFVSFSFELSAWPDFADIAIFDESQETGLVGVIRPNISADYPTIITIGPSFFESYKTMPKGTKFIHGFNMGANSSAARAATWDSAPYACKAIGSDLLYWEYGNEPDLFHASGYRPLNWTEADYVSEWLNGTNAIEEAVKSACPDLAGTKFMAPSFAGVEVNDYFKLAPVKAWGEGLDKNKNIEVIASHNYMGVSTDLGITLQGTLMNHTNVIIKAERQLNVSRGIRALENAPELGTPFILGEHNSLARQGRPGLSNSFGAALWGVDWNVYIASQNISRSHMHQGTNYRYQSWQPVETNITTRGTKPPYYGNVAVAAFMHKSTPSSQLQISHLDSSSEFSTQYAAHIDNTLTRLLLVDLHTYNTTDNNYTTPFERPMETYNFKLPSSCKDKAQVQRLMANGSDAITGITWDGYSYNYELDEGKPVRMNNVTCGESVHVDENGMLKVAVPWSSAAIVSLDC
ncbi:glycoside hydrolase family 79 protein [Stemphylium lycopersici]|uniref:Glycoside hydrolase family 79 protein n=1 Tax=Stemphylium lycopersici TaxID=183478 RepID=A0A364N0B3_STELY|nr:glycoside hydrolase family 79 protein [Stemphylium lycopersici]RAR08671.1 glycoside hydrolase family 79 protein [Stemphylium lycopersici]